jgi:hypothetical protein
VGRGPRDRSRPAVDRPVTHSRWARTLRSTPAPFTVWPELPSMTRRRQCQPGATPRRRRVVHRAEPSTTMPGVSLCPARLVWTRGCVTLGFVSPQGLDTIRAVKSWCRAGPLSEYTIAPCQSIGARTRRARDGHPHPTTARRYLATPFAITSRGREVLDSDVFESLRARARALRLSASRRSSRALRTVSVGAEH